jgi:hypothetical protein
VDNDPNQFFFPNIEDLPQLRSPHGNVIPFAQLIAIDVNNLDAEFETHAAWQSAIGVAFAVAEADAGFLSRRVKRVRAQKFFEVRKALTPSGVTGARGPSLDMIDSKITLEPEVEELEEKLSEAEKKVAILNQALRAFISRKDLLVQLGASVRADKIKVFKNINAED